MRNQRVMAVCNAVYRTDVAPAKRMVLLMLLDLSCFFVFIPVKAKLMPWDIENKELLDHGLKLQSSLVATFFPSRKPPFWVTPERADKPCPTHCAKKKMFWKSFSWGWCWWKRLSNVNVLALNLNVFGLPRLDHESLGFLGHETWHYTLLLFLQWP